MIKFHQNQDDFSRLTIFQYTRTREDLVNQLNDLLKKIRFNFTVQKFQVNEQTQDLTRSILYEIPKTS